MTKVLVSCVQAAIAFVATLPKLSRQPTPLARGGRQPCVEPT
jgi:hypothetical protein